LELHSFFIRLLAYALLLSGIIYALQQYTTILPDGTWVVFGFFFTVSFIIFVLSYFVLKTSPATSIKLLIITLMIRLFLSFGFFVIYVSATGNTSVSFAVIFIILYLLFTVFENYHLVINLRPDSKKDSIRDK